MSVRQAVREALKLLDRRDRRLLGLSIAIQVGTSFLDLIGVLLIGMVGALAVTTVQSQPPPTIVQSTAAFFGLENASDQMLVLILAGTAAIVLLSKSIVSSFLTRRVLIFLANRQALVSARLTRELLSRPLTFIQRRSSQQTAYALLSGTAAATSQILGQMTVIITELALLIVLGTALLILSPWVATGAILFFAIVGLGLQRAIGSWASRVGAITAAADIDSLNAIQEALGAYREISVANRRALYVDRIQGLRWRAAKVAADTQFITMIPKYMFEAALVVGGLLLAAFLFATQDAVLAVGTLALFLAAGTRVMPSLLRLQTAALGLRGAAGVAGPAFDLAADLEHPRIQARDATPAVQARAELGYDYLDLVPSIDLRGVSVTYPESHERALIDVDLHALPGQSIALTGPSGAGKSTLADVILGILQPDSGTALLGGLPPEVAVERWPGGIAYVPQEVTLANASVRSNVALGIPAVEIDDNLVWEALERAHLAELVRSLPQGLDTGVGERGLRFSGGQRQRLGIARALYTRPRILVLDEATSALDAESERAITLMVDGLEGSVTTVIIAHRLSTVRDVDQLVYLEKGRVVAIGSFDSVVARNPAFARQASLMGLA